MKRRALRRSRSATVFAVAALTFAAVLANTGSASAASVSSVRSWSAGTLAPGQSKTYSWRNANSDLYQANAGAMRTDLPETSCIVDVTRQWYRRAAGGSREFLLTIMNPTANSCDVTVYLAIITADRSGATGVINPGQTWSTRWNNARPDSFVYLAGVTPSAPTSGTCELEVTWRARVAPNGENEFLWFIRNVGTVACDGQWRLGWLPVDDAHPYPFGNQLLDPTHQYGMSPGVDDPFRVYAFGLVPERTDDGRCDLAPVIQRMVGEPTNASPGTRDAVIGIHWVVVGPVRCVIRAVTVAYIP